MSVRKVTRDYGIAIGAVVVALGLRGLLDPLVDQRLPLATLFGAVAVAVWAAGYKPAIAAMIVGYVAGDYFFLEPRGHINVLSSATDFIAACGYFLSTGVIIVLGEAMRRARTRAADTLTRLADREQRLESTLHSISDAFYTVDREWRYTYINAQAERYYGRPRQEMLGRVLWESRPQLVGSEFERRVRAAVESGTPAHFTYVSPMSHRWLEVRASPTAEGIAIFFLDVHERRTADENLRRTDLQLRHSEELLHLAERAVHAGSWTFDAATGIGKWSERCHELFGTDPRTFVPSFDAWLELVHEADRASARATVTQALAEGSELDAEFRIKHPVKGTRWLWELGRAEYENGRAVRMAGLVFDVTERREAERVLRESEAHFHSMADNTPAILWVTDAHGLTAYLNTRWYEYTGRPAGQDTGLAWLGGVHEADREHAGAVFLRAFERREPVAIDYRLRRHDGEYRWVLDTGLPRYDEAGVFTGYVGCVIDVHERKQLEHALLEADRRKDEFLAILAHELRNPLAPIRNGVAMLKLAGGDEARRRQATELMERQVAQMTRLIDDLLDVSRIATGKVELRTRVAALADVVRQGVETARPYLERLGHQVSVTLPEAPVLVECDPLRLAQIVSNLLSNAGKFTDTGGTIALAVEDAGEVARIRVTDSGIGIPTDKLDTVFDIFVQLDATLERTHGGLGIGLTLVKSLVELHGGTVEAKSAGLGRGSEFIVSLPVAATGDRSHEVDHMPAPIAHRFLVVDDNEDSAESLAMLLRALGSEVQTAFSGHDALELVPAHRPDVVLCDIGMPGMSGYEVARRLRQTPGVERTFMLIALTGFGTEDDRRRSFEAGFDAHLVKPIDLEKLQSTLDALRGGGRAEA
jgi:PAS domain S-box-containing protein